MEGLLCLWRGAGERAKAEMDGERGCQWLKYHLPQSPLLLPPHLSLYPPVRVSAGVFSPFLSPSQHTHMVASRKHTHANHISVSSPRSHWSQVLEKLAPSYQTITTSWRTSVFLTRHSTDSPPVVWRSHNGLIILFINWIFLLCFILNKHILILTLYYCHSFTYCCAFLLFLVTITTDVLSLSVLLLLKLRDVQHFGSST